jgi:hypothetical protein
MRCPVHNVEGCECRFARAPQAAEHPHFCDCDACLNGRAARRRQINLLALTFAGALIACGPRPATCSERDAALLAREATCVARVKTECAGIPIDEPCPFEDSCNAFVRERCK